jgi:uncharacterized protein (DUF1778 family)
MDIDGVVAEFKATLTGQLRLAGDDESVAAAGDAMLTALEPALRQAGSRLAEQAAAEIGAQIPDYTIDVVLEGGQPTLRVRADGDEISINTEDLGARITVRLPENLKDELEACASEIGDSVNTYVVRALAGKAKRTMYSSRSTFDGTITT